MTDPNDDETICESDLSDVRQEIDALRRSIEGLRDLFVHSGEEETRTPVAAELEADLARLDELVVQLSARIERLGRELDERRGVVADASRELVVTVEDLVENLDDLSFSAKNADEMLEAGATSFRADVETMGRIVPELLSSVSRLEEGITALSGAFIELRDDLSQWQSRSRSAVGASAELEARMTELSTGLADLTETLQGLDSQVRSTMQLRQREADDGRSEVSWNEIQRRARNLVDRGRRATALNSAIRVLGATAVWVVLAWPVLDATVPWLLPLGAYALLEAVHVAGAYPG